MPRKPTMHAAQLPDGDQAPPTSSSRDSIQDISCEPPLSGEAQHLPAPKTSIPSTTSGSIQGQDGPAQGPDRVLRKRKRKVSFAPGPLEAGARSENGHPKEGRVSGLRRLPGAQTFMTEDLKPSAVRAVEQLLGEDHAHSIARLKYRAGMLPPTKRTREFVTVAPAATRQKTEPDTAAAAPLVALDAQGGGASQAAAKRKAPRGTSRTSPPSSDDAEQPQPLGQDPPGSLPQASGAAAPEDPKSAGDEAEPETGPETAAESAPDPEPKNGLLAQLERGTGIFSRLSRETSADAAIASGCSPPRQTLAAQSGTAAVATRSRDRLPGLGGGLPGMALGGGGADVGRRRDRVGSLYDPLGPPQRPLFSVPRKGPSSMVMR